VKHRLAVVAATAAAALGLGTGAAFASSFVAYEGPNFTGKQQVVDGCNTYYNIIFHGSYKWYGTGQAGNMYDHPGGPAVFTLRSDANAEQGTGFGWQSIKIIC
jgi:hypothetical protein